MKTRAQRRHKRASVIHRKATIARTVYGYDYFVHGKFAKGKVHCSCWMCSRKSNVHGMKHSDVKAFERDILKLREIDFL